MHQFTLAMKRSHAELARLLLGCRCTGCRWVPHAAGVNRALLQMQFEKDDSKLSFRCTLGKSGGVMEHGSKRSTTAELSKLVPTRLKVAQGATVVDARAESSTKSGLHVDVVLVFDNHAKMSLDVRPLPDAVCETDLPFDQFVGAAEVDSLHRGAARVPGPGPVAVPGFVPQIPLRAVK